MKFDTDAKNGRPKGTINERDPWPICSRPPCTCTSTKHEKLVEHLQVLRFACNDTFTTFHDSKGIEYIVPKRINCGSYEPKKPTFPSRCMCKDLEERKLLLLLYVRPNITFQYLKFRLRSYITYINNLI